MTTLTFAGDEITRRGVPGILRPNALPPPAAIQDEQIAAAVTEVNDLRARATEAGRAATEAQAAVEAAAAADEAARAEAARAGKPRPKATRDAAETKRQRLAEDEKALWQAAEAAANDALTVIGERGPAVAAKLREEASAHREKLAAAISEMEASARALEATGQLAAYLAPTDGALPEWGRFTGKKARLPRAKLRRAPEGGITVADAVGLLREILDQHEANEGGQASAPNPRHLRAAS